MLSRSIRTLSNGFSLIEMIITVVIMAIVVAVALPTYTVWIQNAHIRNAAESILNGLQRARAEAVVRNVNIEFVLDGRNWVVRVVGAADSIVSGAADEVSPNVGITPLPPASSTVTFSNLGILTANTPASTSMAQIGIDSTALAASQSRDLRILILPGGAPRMCDPNVASLTDPRHC